MRKILLGALLIIITLCSSISAANDRFGLGIIIGEPTGPCFKVWTSGTTAIDGALAWSLGKNSSLHLHVDYLIHKFSLIKVERGRLPFYFGIGGRMKFVEDDKDDKIGVRFPIGLEYLFETVSIDIFIEIVPVLDLLPDSDFDMNAALGARYFF